MKFTAFIIAASLFSVTAMASLCVNDNVVYVQNGSHYDAKILRLYEDGTAEVSFPNGEFSVSQVQISSLSQPRQWENGFSVGERVIYTQNGTHYRARLIEIYGDGQVKVDFPDGEFSVSEVSISSLSREIQSAKGFQLGERVVYTQNGTHYAARIMAIYQDNTVEVSFPNGEFSVSQVQISSLSRRLTSLNGFILGEHVDYQQDGSHYDAIINQIFEDGTVEVSFPNGEFSVSQVRMSSLSRPIYCVGGCGR